MGTAAFDQPGAQHGGGRSTAVVRDPGEQQLQASVRAVVGPGIDVEVDGDRVTLRGQVADAEALRRIPELARGVDGVSSVDDQLVVASH